MTNKSFLQLSPSQLSNNCTMMQTKQLLISRITLPTFKWLLNTVKVILLNVTDIVMDHKTNTLLQTNQISFKFCSLHLKLPHKFNRISKHKTLKILMKHMQYRQRMLQVCPNIYLLLSQHHISIITLKKVDIIQDTMGKDKTLDKETLKPVKGSSIN